LIYKLVVKIILGLSIKKQLILFSCFKFIFVLVCFY
jgi:hypothetical protein